MEASSPRSVELNELGSLCVLVQAGQRPPRGRPLQLLLSAEPVPEHPELRVQSCLQVQAWWGISDEELDEQSPRDRCCREDDGVTSNAFGRCCAAPRGTVWTWNAPHSNLILCSWTSSAL